MPSGVGLGSARNDVRKTKNRGLRWLDGWEARVQAAKPGRNGIDYGEIRKVLAGNGQGADYREFPRQVATLYRALALDSRAIVLTGAEAAISRDDFRLEHLQEQLRRDLDDNAQVQTRLLDLLWRLASEPVSTKPPVRPDTNRRAAELQRSLSALAQAASRTPDAPSLLTHTNQQVLELHAAKDGAFRVLSPPVPTA